MTLILTVNGPETIWLLADRRLSYKHKKPKDDARKILCLDTTDGVALLGYAGLGATARGTEPADWMSAVLRGRNLTLEHSLGVLTEALKREFPRHMVGMPGRAIHTVMIPAFVGGEVRLYEIDLLLTPDRKAYFRYTRHVTHPQSAAARTPRLASAGSGALHLPKDRKWMRDLLRIVRASDRRQVTPLTVADHLAGINQAVHLVDKQVGPRCVVAWRHRQGGVHEGGGAHQFYNGSDRESSPVLPTIGRGMDIGAIIAAMEPHMTKSFAAMRSGQTSPEWEKEMHAALALIPDQPDEKLL
jgi:hypothetical protein